MGCTACGARAKALANHLRPYDRVTVDQARLTVQAAAALAVGCLFAVINVIWDDWGPNDTWVLISIMVCLESNVGTGLQKSGLRVIGTTVGGAAGLAMLALTWAAGGGEYWQGASVQMAVTITCLQALVGGLLVLWKVQHPAHTYAAVVALFTGCIVWVPGLRATDPTAATKAALRRIVSVLFGVVIAALAQLLVLPVFARRQLTERLAAALEEAVTLLYDGVVPEPGSTRGAAGSHAAKLQRAQRRVAAGLDGLLAPTAVELRLIRGPLTAADFAALVDAVAAVGSTAVQVAAVLELAHAGPEGAHSPSLPGDLEGKLAETAEALSAVFHVLAARILATLEGCCLQRHRWENRLPCIPAGRRGPKADGPAAAPIDAGATAAPLLEAAAAAFQRLERGREAQRGSLAPSDVDLCVVASGACLVLLQQARAVAAVLDAAGQLGADSGEEIRLSIPPPATKFDGD